MFKEEKGIKALPLHSLYNHKILLEEGKEPPFLLIYRILEADLGTLKEYINTNLKKGFIRLLTLLVGSLVLLILKKDRIKQLYINY